MASAIVCLLLLSHLIVTEAFLQINVTGVGSVDRIITCDEPRESLWTIDSMTIGYPVDLESGVSDQCYCLLYAKSPQTWTDQSSVQVLLNIHTAPEPQTWGWESLGRLDAVNTEPTSIEGIKFGYRYTGSGEPTFYIITDQNGERVNPMRRDRHVIFTPDNIVLYLSCHPSGYYDPRQPDVGTVAPRPTTTTTTTTPSTTDTATPTATAAATTTSTTTPATTTTSTTTTTTTAPTTEPPTSQTPAGPLPSDTAMTSPDDSTTEVIRISGNNGGNDNNDNSTAVTALIVVVILIAVVAGTVITVGVVIFRRKLSKAAQATPIEHTNKHPNNEPNRPAGNDSQTYMDLEASQQVTSAVSGPYMTLKTMAPADSSAATYMNTPTHSNTAGAALNAAYVNVDGARDVNNRDYANISSGDYADANGGSQADDSGVGSASAGEYEIVNIVRNQ